MEKLEAKNEQLHVMVRYAAAEKPFEEEAQRSETVGQLKTQVLNAFGLTEGSGQGGAIITYTLYFDKRPLDNLNETLGTVAGERGALELKLVQQITQGKSDKRRPVRA